MLAVLAFFALFSRAPIDTDSYRFLKGQQPLRAALTHASAGFDAQGSEERTYELIGDYKEITAKSAAELIPLGYKIAHQGGDFVEWNSAKRIVLISDSFDSDVTIVQCYSPAPDGLWLKCRIIMAEAARSLKRGRQ